MKTLSDIFNESLLDDIEDQSNPIEEFYKNPFKSIWAYRDHYKSQKDWESYVDIFEDSIKQNCLGELKTQINTNKLIYTITIAPEGADKRSVIRIKAYRNKHVIMDEYLLSYRRSPKSLRIGKAKYYLLFPDYSKYRAEYILSDNQMQQCQEMLKYYINDDIIDYVKKIPAH